VIHFYRHRQHSCMTRCLCWLRHSTRFWRRSQTRFEPTSGEVRFSTMAAEALTVTRVKAGSHLGNMATRYLATSERYEPCVTTDNVCRDSKWLILTKSTWLGYEMDDQGYITIRPALWPTQPPIQWVPRAIKPGVKRTGRETDPSSHSTVVVKNAWSYNFTPPIRLQELG